MDQNQLNDIVESFEARLMQRVENIFNNELESRIREIFLNASPPAEPPNDSVQPDNGVEQGVEGEQAAGEAEREEEQFPQFQLKPQLQHEEPRCPICLEQIDTIATPCNHTFHAGCLAPWVLENRNCPICRSAISMEDITQPD